MSLIDTERTSVDDFIRHLKQTYYQGDESVDESVVFASAPARGGSVFAFS